MNSPFSKISIRTTNVHTSSFPLVLFSFLKIIESHSVMSSVLDPGVTVMSICLWDIIVEWKRNKEIPPTPPTKKYVLRKTAQEKYGQMEFGRLKGSLAKKSGKVYQAEECTKEDNLISKSSQGKCNSSYQTWRHGSRDVGTGENSQAWTTGRKKTLTGLGR